MFELMKTFVANYRGEYGYDVSEMLYAMYDFKLLTAEEIDELMAILRGKGRTHKGKKKGK